MKKLFLGIFVLGLLFCGSAYAFFKKDVKGYLCNYQEGIFNNPDLGKTGDPCLEGGTSKYKFYIGGKFKAEMLRQYPTDAWMIGCDDKW